jgi:hypothetical protein
VDCQVPTYRGRNRRASSSSRTRMIHVARSLPWRHNAGNWEGHMQDRAKWNYFTSAAYGLLDYINEDGSFFKLILVSMKISRPFFPNDSDAHPFEVKGCRRR